MALRLPLSQPRSAQVQPSWRQHAAVLALMGLLSILLSWPLLPNLTERVIGSGGFDSLHHVWYLWHVQQAIIGPTELFHSSLLSYPAGHSLFTHGLGPVVGMLALPFWPLGPAAAINGASLLSLILSGYTTYLLARELGLDVELALFAGIFLLAAPMHLAGLRGHLNKLLLVGPALVLLFTIRTLRPDRSRWWGLAAAGALLLTLAHDGYQFIFTAVLLPLLALLWLAVRPRRRRGELAARLLLTLAFSAAALLPYLLSIRASVAELGIEVSRAAESFQRAPDVLAFLLPHPTSNPLLGSLFTGSWSSLGVHPTIEQTVFLSWTGLLLAIIAAVRGGRRARMVLALSVAIMLLALGPVLKLAGSALELKLSGVNLMPYALASRIPGLGFMRAPGRAMMVGYILWAVCAAYGLQLVRRRCHAHPRAVVVAASLLVLLEFWPPLWASFELPETPDFYQQIADDGASYGVLDLPLREAGAGSHIDYSSRYQIYQMTHGKGILGGYLSRTFDRHPLLPCIVPTVQPMRVDVLVDGQPADCTDTVLRDLTDNNYRYIVFHKQSFLDSPGTPPNPAPGDPSQTLRSLLQHETPHYQDDQVLVYRLPVGPQSRSDAATTLALGEGWGPSIGRVHWLRSPAALAISSPDTQQAELMLFAGSSARSQLHCRTGFRHMSISDGEETWTFRLGPEPQMIEVPLKLEPGTNVLQLKLSDCGWHDLFEPPPRALFVQRVELALGARGAAAERP